MQGFLFKYEPLTFTHSNWVCCAYNYFWRKFKKSWEVNPEGNKITDTSADDEGVNRTKLRQLFVCFTQPSGPKPVLCGTPFGFSFFSDPETDEG